MDHDYAHCLDYKENCPKDCFRAELSRDLERLKGQKLILSWMHLEGTEICKLVEPVERKKGAAPA